MLSATSLSALPGTTLYTTGVAKRQVFVSGLNTWTYEVGAGQDQLVHYYDGAPSTLKFFPEVSGGKVAFTPDFSKYLVWTVHS